MATRKPATEPPAPARSESDSDSPLAALPGQQSLAQLVHLVRSEKVLLDADLAMLYGVETGALNRAVKRNLDRFPADFMFPLIQGVLEPLGKWNKVGDPNHVIMGGLDGDVTACRLLKEGYIDATGVQDLYFEADSLMTAMLSSIALGEKTPENWIDDPGFALTGGNLAEREMDMWGCKLLAEK